ncbi:hypothetical protein N0V82_006751 [Gnomoniopsis sp. IMI 355080]|nr:hypothetical protein N0V82_006751 [Gnomoniopsis sp. IMI 355080]
MAPLDDMSAPGTATYDSDTMTVGDGTWDFSKNDFLLPNLVGLNLETTQYNGMANRFSTLPQYHSLIKAHGIIGAIVFLFIIPAAVFYARFYTRRPGYAIRFHAYLQILAVLLTTAVFILGWFAVGPERSLTNPHHGIGVAIYTLILIQIFGGWIIKNIRGRSLRVMLHQWFGRTIALLGIAQVPMGLALYGSPKYLFILYALWMAFLLLMYFFFDYRAWDRPDYIIRDRDGRSEVTQTERTERTSGASSRWLGPAAAAGGLWALMRGRKKDRASSRERSRSRSRASRIRSRSRAPEVIPSRRQSYIEEKHTDRYSEKPKQSSSGSGGGFMDRFLGLGAGLGAGALISRMTGRRNRVEDEEYSAIATDTPSRRRHSRSSRRRGGTVVTDYSDESEEYRRDGRRSPLLPGPGGPSAMAAAISAAERRPSGSRPTRPMTPQRSHRRGDSIVDSTLDSDYSSYVSPSRRDSEPRHSKGAAEKGLLAGLGLGWFAKKMKDRKDNKKDDRLREEEERLRIEEDERRAGHHEPRYTGDGYGHNTPPRRHSRRQSLRPAAPIRAGTEATMMTEEESSLIEPRPLSGYDAPRPDLSDRNYQQYQPPPSGPVPPPVGQYTAHTAVAPTPPPSIPVPADNARTQSRHSFIEPAAMPVIPDDPRGILARSSESESYVSQGDRRRSESRRRAGEAAMAAAASSAGMLAAEQEAQRRVEEERGASRGRTPPVSVKVKVHDDKDRNVTLRRLTEEEAMAARRDRRRRADSASSISGSEIGSGSRSRYRRDASRRRAAEEGAESVVAPLSPPQPSFAGGKRPKDSAYYSGPPPVPGPSGTQPGAGATVSTLASHGTWSGLSPVGTPGVPGPSEAASATASAADRRRRRRLERRNERPAASGTVDFT